MALTQSNTLTLDPNSWLLGGQGTTNKSQGLLNQGGYGTLFGNTPSGNVTNTSTPGIVPQVYSGSTGSGSNQNTSTNNYGGFTPGPQYNYTPTYGSQNNVGTSQGAAVYDAMNPQSQGQPKSNPLTTTYGTQFGPSNPNTQAQSGGGIQQAFAGLTPQQKATYIQANPGVASQYGFTAQTSPTSVGSFNLNGINNGLTSGGQQSQVNNNQGTSMYNAPTNTGPNPYPGGDPFSGMNGLYAKMLSDYYNRTKQFDDSNLDVNKTSQDLEDFQKNYANTIAGVQGNNNWSLDTQQGKAQVLGNQAANTLPYLQTKLNQATALRGQNLGAMSDIAGKLSPVSQFGVLTSPVNGQPISGGSPQSAAFNGGQIQASIGQGGTYQQNKQVLDSLNAPTTGMVDNFDQFVQQSGLNKNDTTIVNSLVNAFNNLGPTQFPQLQSGFNNIVAQYAKILGPQKFNSLLQSSQGSTIDSFFGQLNDQANAVQSGLSNAGTGGTTSQNGSQSSSSNSSNSSIYNF